MDCESEWVNYRNSNLNVKNKTFSQHQINVRGNEIAILFQLSKCYATGPRCCIHSLYLAIERIIFLLVDSNEDFLCKADKSVNQLEYFRLIKNKLKQNVDSHNAKSFSEIKFCFGDIFLSFALIKKSFHFSCNSVAEL